MSDLLTTIFAVVLIVACVLAVPLGLAFLVTYVAPAASFAVIFWWALGIELLLTLGSTVFSD